MRKGNFAGEGGVFWGGGPKPNKGKSKWVGGARGGTTTAAAVVSSVNFVNYYSVGGCK